jgi:hypothetical protein
MTPEPPASHAASGPRALGLFLISVAILALQVLQTRILSVQMWHHHSYMVVTMTLLGFAAAGSLVTVWPGLLRGDVSRTLAWCSVLFAASTVLGYALLAQTADKAAEMTADGRYVTLSIFYSYLLIPYFFGGLAITICLSATRDVHGLYFVNLMGSAVGAWVFLAVITPLGGERLLILCALTGPLAALSFRPPTRGLAASLPSLGALAACGLLFAKAPEWMPIEVASNKAQADVLRRIEGAELIDQRWTPLCRLDLVRMPDKEGAAGAINIYQDGDAITVMHSDESWDVVPGFSLNTLAYLPHYLRFVDEGVRPEALAIGIGGGIDLRYALGMQVKSVLGIEINAETVRLVGEDYADFNGDIYHRTLPEGGPVEQRVEVEVGEGRSTMRRLDRQFDVIQLSGTDTYTAGNSGAYVLSESYLYTSEAIGEYFDHLKPGGTLGFIRLAYDPPRENLRLFAIGLSELRKRGVERPSDHVAVIVHELPHPDTGEVIRFVGTAFSIDPLPADMIERGYARADEIEDHKALYFPGIAPERGEKHYLELAAAIDAGTEEAFYEAYPWEVRPVFDDSPFFFHFHTWRSLFGGTEAEDEDGADEWHELTGGPIGLQILATLLVQTTLLVALLVLLPLFALRLREHGSGSTPHAWRHLAYFLGLGAGFMFLEISTVQRLVLFLGHPTYSLTVTLSCFLFFAGLGSLYSRRFHDRPGATLRRVVPLLGLIIAVLALVLEPLLASLLHLPLPVRIAIAVALLAPMNFLMGMPFPVGLSRLQRLAPRLVPWALGANGGASVIGSILCIVLAMESGFRAVSLVALGAYLLGTLLVTTGPLSPTRSGG